MRRRTPRLEQFYPRAPITAYSGRAALNRVQSTSWAGRPVPKRWVVEDSPRLTDAPSSVRKRATQESASPIRAYLLHRLSHLLKHHFDQVDGRPVQVDRDAALNLWSLLIKVCNDSSVYPYISSDGEAGVSASWRAGTNSIQLVADIDGEIWSLIREHGGNPVIEQIQLDHRVQIIALKEAIARLSATVTQENPGWRDSFIGL